MTCMTALLAGCQSAPDMDVEQQVDALYQKMPQEERIAQLKSMYMDELFDEQGQLDTVKCRELIPFGIGHFSQFALQKPRDPNVVRDMVAAVQKWLMENTPNGIPALFHEERLPRCVRWVASCRCRRWLTCVVIPRLTAWKSRMVRMATCQQ